MKQFKKRVGVWFKFCLKHKTKILFFALLAVFILLRFYELPQRASLGWDQADSAWAARDILVQNPIKLQGVPIKGNAGMFMGPLYYYLITPFYFFTGLDMIASPIFAAVVSVVSFLAFYFITKKLFDTNTALIAAFIYTFSAIIMVADRTQAAFVLIPIISYAVFYFLYKCITGHEKHVVYLAAVIGFGFHVHFTSAFFLIIGLLALPFFPWNKKFLLYSLLAVVILLVFLSPMLYSVFFAKSSGSNGIVTYLNASYHGLHLTRVLQLTHDGFISFQQILQFPILRPLAFVLLPIFIFVYIFTVPKKQRRERFLFSYLMVLFVVVPWIVFATYNGELTDYYFSHSRFLVIAAIAFLLMQIMRMKVLAAKLFVAALLLFYGGYNAYSFFQPHVGNYFSIKQAAETSIRNNEKLIYKDRDPHYYMYRIGTKE